MKHGLGSISDLAEFLANMRSARREPDDKDAAEAQLFHLASLSGLPYKFSTKLQLGPVFMDRDSDEVPAFNEELNELFTKLFVDFDALIKKHFGEKNALTALELIDLAPAARAALHAARGVEPPVVLTDDDVNGSKDSDAEQQPPYHGTPG